MGIRLRQTSLLAKIPIPVEGIVSSLRAAAVPGYTGIVLLEIGIKPEAAEHIMLGVLRKPTFKTDAQPQQISIPATGDPERNGLVNKVMAALREKLCLRTEVIAIEAHYNDGRLLKFQIVE